MFEDGSKYAGHFWELIDTRPYMRGLQALVRIGVEGKQYKKSVYVVLAYKFICKLLTLQLVK